MFSGGSLPFPVVKRCRACSSAWVGGWRREVVRVYQEGDGGGVSTGWVRGGGSSAVDTGREGGR